MAEKGGQVKIIVNDIVMQCVQQLSVCSHLQRVHSKIDFVSEERPLELLSEETLIAYLRERDIENLVACRCHLLELKLDIWASLL